MELKSELLTPLWWHFSSEVAGKNYSFKIVFEHFAITAISLCIYSHSLKDKLRAILKATYTHARNLACFVFTYKGLQALQHSVHGKSLQSHSFLAACVGGWLIFGDNNNINSQVQVSIWNPLVPCYLALIFIYRYLAVYRCDNVLHAFWMLWEIEINHQDIQYVYNR